MLPKRSCVLNWGSSVQRRSPGHGVYTHLRSWVSYSSVQTVVTTDVTQIKKGRSVGTRLHCTSDVLIADSYFIYLKMLK